MSPELITAVKERINLGHTKEMIREELKSAGYDDSIINTAYTEAVGEKEENVAAVPLPTEPIQSNVGATMTVAVLPGAVDLFKKGWNYALSRIDVVILVAVISTVLSVAEFLTSEDSTYTLDDSTMLTVSAVQIIFSILSVATTFAVLYIVSESAERKVSIGEGYAWASRNFFPLIWVLILAFLVVFGGFLLFIVPGIIVSLYVYFSQYVYVKEGKRGVSALLRSADLVKGNWLNLFGKLLLFFLLIILVAFAFGFVVGLVVTLASLSAVVSDVATSLLGAVFTLISISVGFQLYQSLAAAKPSAMAPSEYSDKWKYVALAVFGLVAIPVYVFLVTSVANELEVATGYAEVASVKLELSTVRVNAELYRFENDESYEGFCQEVVDITSAIKTQCNDSEDSYAVAATIGEDTMCVDSTVELKNISSDLGTRTSCLSIPE